MQSQRKECSGEGQSGWNRVSKRREDERGGVSRGDVGARLGSLVDQVKKGLQAGGMRERTD